VHELRGRGRKIPTVLSKTSHSPGNIVKDFEKRDKPCQVQSPINLLGHAGKDHLTSIPPLTRLLGIDHHPQTSTGDVIQVTHIEYDFESSGFVDRGKRICQLGSGTTIYATNCLDQVAAFELVGSDLQHELTSFVRYDIQKPARDYGRIITQIEHGIRQNGFVPAARLMLDYATRQRRAQAD
jgi:hypothetical protein